MLWEELAQEVSGRTAVVGVGAAGSGDGGVGPMVVELLTKAGIDSAIEGGPSPELDAWRIRDLAPASVVFIDAIDFGGSPGDVALMRTAEVGEKTLDSRKSSAATRLRCVEEGLKAKCFLVAVQPDHVRAGAQMCDEVRYAASRVARTLLDSVMKQAS